jgi:adenylosuccinate synthase
VIGLAKAYCTRVGNGPFPTELNDDTGERLRQEGWEFGSTTGRSRRCGWLDLFALKYSAMINGITEIALTKLDVLNSFDEIKVCTGYEVDGRAVKYFPSDCKTLDRVTPIYESFPGWCSSLESCRTFEDLPEKTRRYVEAIEQYVGARVDYIGTGPEREQTIAR